MLNIRMQNKEVRKLTPKITVIGVGGAGGNAVNNMISAGLQGVEFVVCNTDAQALESSLCDNRLQLGATVTGGLGAGARPEVGRQAAEESLDDVMQYLEGANMAFITAGMGGGTGTGAAPVIARACREKGILTVGVVTKPFHFEGTLRMKMAEGGIGEMQDYVDTLIVIPNQNLFRIANEKTTFAEAFRMADSVLQSGVRGVTDLMIVPGLINLDFADIRSAMLEMGKAMMGTGEATGERRAIEAAEKAINNPLLDDVSMKGARAVIINVTGGYDMTLFEVDEACNRIRDEVDPNANIIVGSTFSEAMEGVMRVSVVATGIDVAESKVRRSGSIGPATLNAITAQQQDRRLDRTAPTAIAAPVAEYPAVLTPRVTVPGTSIPVMPLNVRATGMPAAPAVASQPEVAPPAVQYAQQYNVPPPAAVTVTAEPVSVNESGGTAFHQVHGPKATVMGDTFIPPAPVEIEAGVRHAVSASVTDTQSGYGPNLGALAARRPVAAEPATTLPGLPLRTPAVTAASSTPRKRMPSLLDRLTGTLRHQGEHPPQSVPAGSPMAAPSFSAPMQGSLNIEPPRAPASAPSDEELDIPAFLRRQAN